MVKLADVRTANAKLFIDDAAYIAVFLVASMGLGEYFVNELARVYGNGGHGTLFVILVGRSQSKMQRVIDFCLALAPTAQFEFVDIQDAALIKDIDAASRKVKDVLSTHGLRHIDLLAQTQTRTDLTGQRKESVEGLDRSMSLLCYSRLRFAQNLMTELCSSPRPSHVVSIYAAGMEKPVNMQDVSLRRTYNFSRCRSHCVAIKTLVFEQMARESEGKVVFVHYFPGLVVTPGYNDEAHPTWFKVIWTLLSPLVKVTVATSPSESGQRMLYLASSRFPSEGQESETEILGTDGRPNSGAYAVNADDEPISPKKLADFYDALRNDGSDAKLRNHVNMVFQAITSGSRFNS